ESLLLRETESSASMRADIRTTTDDEWKAIKIKEFIRCVETSGRCQPGRPVEDVTKDVLIPVTGNEALRRATIYFRYSMEQQE
uniref:hypothetical protein n=1 Tax=Mobilibacterium timonense TaxID=1871012 RepID=UPI003A93B76D